MARDRFNRFVQLGDKVRIIERGRSLRPSSRLYRVDGVQPTILCDVSRVLLDNGKEYYSYNLLKEEKISCS